MKKEKGISIVKMGNLMIVDGKAYEPFKCDHKSDCEILRFHPVNEERFKFLIKSATAKLRAYVNSDDIIMSALADMSMKELEKINLELKKKKPKARKEHGCLDLVVGKTVIPVR
jgi:hypothetical protein